MWLEVVKNFTEVTYLVMTTLQKLVMGEVLQSAHGSSVQGNSSSVVKLSGMCWQKEVI